MRSVMISIRPKWCELILSGRKTLEVRKSRPKLDAPFKVYIYCTQGFGKNTLNIPIPFEKIRDDYIETGSMVSLNCPVGNCKVIGEFVCDRIYQYASDLFRSTPIEGTDISTEEMARLSCLTAKELYEYEHTAEPRENCIYLVGVYGWHISNLVIYDRPKELKEFRNPCAEYAKDNPQCGRCEYYHSMGEYPAECGCDGVKPLTKPPQSWCYVEELREDVLRRTDK